MQWNDIYPDKSSNIDFQPRNELEESYTTELDKQNAQVDSSAYNPRYHHFETAYKQYLDIKPYSTYTKLDNLLPKPFLLSSSLTVLHANDKPGKGFLIHLLIKLILKYYSQGIVFIDCTNVFPAYEIIEATVNMDSFIDPHLPIRAIQLSRSFNYHQTTEILTEHLEPLVRNGFTYSNPNSENQIHVKPKFIIITGLPDLYLNQESAQYLEYDGRPEWFSIYELQHAIGHLRMITQKYDLISLITSSTAPKSKLKPLGGSFFTHSASTLIKIFTEGNGIYGDLIKHPFAKPKSLLLQLLRPKNKKITSRRLSSFIS